MSNHTLQIERSIGGTLPDAGNVVFGRVVSSNGTIVYDSNTGIITLL
ncbi:MAG: hypothetical protein WCP73_06080 [Eubacteriales bacterium]